jgi:hypothetical protein
VKSFRFFLFKKLTFFSSIEIGAVTRAVVGGSFFVVGLQAHFGVLHLYES